MLTEQVKQLEEEVESLKQVNERLKTELELLKEWALKAEELLKHMIPNQLFTHKERRNTTIKFLDGSSMTVKRRKGEKDCIETAIAYCVLKQLISPSELKKLIDNKEAK